VIFIPSADPPHKDLADIAPAAHRLAMTRLAVERHPAFEASDFEATRGEKSYSLYTIEHFRAALGPAAEIFFIIGADAFAEIATWHRWREVLAAASFIVMTRPGARVASPGDAMPAEVAALYREAGGGWFVRDDGTALLFLPVTGLDIAASDIRRRVRAGRSIRYLAPDAVADYIYAQRLYQGNSS
jgi:nicotinate-nucleotide adenylyltransferase